MCCFDENVWFKKYVRNKVFLKDFLCLENKNFKNT